MAMTYKSITRKLIYPLALLCALIFLIYQYNQTQSMREELEVLGNRRSALQTKVDFLRELIYLDTLLLDNSYEEAYEAIAELRPVVGDSIETELVAIYERLIEHQQKQWKNVQSRPALPRFSSSLQSPIKPDYQQAVSLDIDSLENMQNKLDSMAFALQKAELFADKLQVQVDENKAGNYLSFKSLKGNLVYYVGDTKKGKANGLGVGLLSTGSRYEGEWKNNQKHGKGIFRWQDGASYDGEYKNDLRHGHGTYHWPDGERFVGKWENDVRNGQGTFYDANGKQVASGLWRDDELVKSKKEK